MGRQAWHALTKLRSYPPLCSPTIILFSKKPSCPHPHRQTLRIYAHMEWWYSPLQRQTALGVSASEQEVWTSRGSRSDHRVVEEEWWSVTQQQPLKPGRYWTSGEPRKPREVLRLTETTGSERDWTHTSKISTEPPRLRRTRLKNASFYVRQTRLRAILQCSSVIRPVRFPAPV